MSERPRIVIVGGGFAGLWATRSAARCPADVTLVDRENYHAFIPLIYQVGAAELEPEEVSYPIRGIFRKQKNVRFLMEKVTRVDFERRLVHTSGAVIEYDYLVLATGSVPNYYRIEGAEKNSFPLRTLEDAIALRNRALNRLEQADAESDETLRRKALTFAIVGGGATGVEFAGALAELVRGPLAKDFHQLDLREEVRLLLLQALPELLPDMPKRCQRYALERLRHMGVEVHLSAPVAKVDEDAVELQDGRRLEAGTVIWTAGVLADPFPASWGLAAEKNGRLRVLPTLQVPDHPEVYAVGDLAAVHDGERALPMLASVAIQEGEAVGRNIGLAIAGKEPVPFRYRDPGVLATIGRNAGVARVRGIAFVGFLAWLLWVSVHLYYLIGFRRRTVVLLSWALDYLFQDRAIRVIIPTCGRFDRPD
jgi:NADH dehydrogenase